MQARLQMIKDNMDKYKNRLAPLKVTAESMMIFECQLDFQYLLDALQQAHEKINDLEKRLEIDPGGSDKIDELESAIGFMKHDHDVKLKQSQAELAQYRENPLLLMQPCHKYVKKNNISRQLMHILEEVKEADTAKSIDDIYLECWDIFQGSVTLMAILREKYGVDLQELTQRGIQKNTNRKDGSYYG